MRKTPVELFVADVRAGRTPSRETLESVADVLEALGRPKEVDRRQYVLEQIETLRQCGPYKISDACATVCSVTAFDYSAATVSEWFSKGRYKTERRAARDVVAAKLLTFRNLLGDDDGAHLLLALTTRQLDYWRKHGSPRIERMRDGRSKVTLPGDGMTLIFDAHD